MTLLLLTALALAQDALEEDPDGGYDPFPADEPDPFVYEPGPRPPVETGDIDWDALGHETAQLLSGYLKINNANPPGNETEGARYLAGFLAAQGIGSEIVEMAPGRSSLIARIEGGDEPALCLLHHIDTATAEAESWQHDPWSGHIDEDGVVWGRGALDMKGLGAVEVMTMALLARRDVALRRDVVLIAVPDEEVGSTGIQHLVEQRWDEIGCSHVVNEGGIGLKDVFFEGQTAYTISIGEKGVLWVKMTARGEPGHGSTPVPGQAPERLLAAVDALGERKVKAVFHPALMEMLANSGRHHGGLAGAVLKSPFLVRLLVKKKLMGHPLTRAAITDTVNLTGLGGAEKPNVVTSAAWVQLDCRLQPGTTVDEMMATLRDLVGDDVELEIMHSAEAEVSEWQDDPFYTALAKHVVAGEPNAVAGPVISVGYTDSVYLRKMGVRAYGVAPFAVSDIEAATMHGDDERVSTDNLRHGLETIYNAVYDVSAEGVD